MMIRDMSVAIVFVLIASVTHVCSQGFSGELDRFELTSVPNRIDMITIDFYAIKRSAYSNAQSLANKYRKSSRNEEAIEKIIAAALQGENSCNADLKHGLSFFPEVVREEISAKRKELFDLYCRPKSIKTVEQAVESIQSFYAKYSYSVNSILIQWYEECISKYR